MTYVFCTCNLLAIILITKFWHVLTFLLTSTAHVRIEILKVFSYRCRNRMLLVPGPSGASSGPGAINGRTGPCAGVAVQ